MCATNVGERIRAHNPNCTQLKVSLVEVSEEGAETLQQSFGRVSQGFRFAGLETILSLQ